MLKSANDKTPDTHCSVNEAQELINQLAGDFGMETISLVQAYGRVLAENIYADRNYPPFNRSAVDGFAIRSQDLLNEGEFEMIEEVFAGAVAQQAVGYKTTIKVMTGAPVPLGADAVIKVEDSEINGKKIRFVLQSIPAKANISLEGEDTLQGQLVIEKNQRCTPHVLATLASLGKSEIQVYKHPVVVILSTGDEIKKVDEKILSYQIRDSNSYSLQGFFKQYGITVSHCAIVPDDKYKLKEAVEHASAADLLIISGGVSMGDADFVPEVLHEAGIEKLFHKVAIKPGKPLWVGNKGRKMVFALPGNPFSTQVAFKIFIEPYLRDCFGLNPLLPLRLSLNTLKKKKTKFDEYFPCRILDSGLELVSFNGSGDIKAAIGSDGIAVHLSDRGEIKEGEAVDFFFWHHFN